MRWVVDNTSWPVGADNDELTPRQVLAVLDEVGCYWPGAVESLAATETPEADRG